MLCELETDKVSVEVPAPASGTLTEIIAGEGETVQAGVPSSRSCPRADGAAAPAKSGSHPAEEAPARSSAKDVEDAPSAKKAMAEAGSRAIRSKARAATAG